MHVAHQREHERDEKRDSVQPRMNNNRFHQVGQKGQPVKRLQKGKTHCFNILDLSLVANRGIYQTVKEMLLLFLTLETVETQCDLLLRTGGKNSDHNY